MRSVQADAQWDSILHDHLKVEWPCGEQDRFRAIWRRIEDELGVIGLGHDANDTLGTALWCIARHLPMHRVMETGVARGITSRVLLEAMSPKGELWSIDLPPMLPDWVDQWGIAVPSELRTRWHYVRGSSRRRMPKVLQTTGSIDLFVHDSLHTERTMSFELALSWRYVRPGGVVVADDVDQNDAFERLALRRDCAWSVLAPAGGGRVFGIVQRAPF